LTTTPTSKTLPALFSLLLLSYHLHLDQDRDPDSDLDLDQELDPDLDHDHDNHDLDQDLDLKDASNPLLIIAAVITFVPEAVRASIQKHQQ